MNTIIIIQCLINIWNELTTWARFVTDICYRFYIVVKSFINDDLNTFIDNYASDVRLCIFLIKNRTARCLGIVIWEASLIAI